MKSTDAKNSGFLSADSMELVIQHSSLSHEAQLELRQLLYKKFGSEEVEYAEFVQSVADWKRHLQEELCRLAFGTLDVNSDGHISMDELQKILGEEISTSPGVMIPLRDILGLQSRDVDAILDQFDLDKDGQISFNEFISTWSTHQPRNG